MNAKASYVLLVALGTTACAHSSGTEPHEMSTAGHEQAASQEDSLAAQAPPNAAQPAQCEGRICWTDMTGRDESAKKHKELAEQHREASQALRDAEARACAGLTIEDRDMSPFAHRSDIASVSQLIEEPTSGRGATKRTAGATITFRATPGLTAEWLQRIVDCHLARNAALGHKVDGMPYCPLVPNGAQAKVRSAGSGFAVDVRSDDDATAAEIYERAQQLASVH